MNRVGKTFFAGFEARLHRSFISRSVSWGDAPGCNDSAPLALKTNARFVGREVLSAKGAGIMNSLGHRPRISSTAELTALKARFIPVLSAKGAAIMNSLGHRPRISSTAELTALKARFIPVLSAKGAGITNSLGHRPRISSTAELTALKVRFIPKMRS
jgi:hypothetical protein